MVGVDGLGPVTLKLKVAAPPRAFFTRTIVAGRSLLVMEQLAVWPRARVIWFPETMVAPEQLQALALYPDGPLSVSVYVPMLTSPETPPAPEMGVGPVALKTKLPGSAVPP